MKYTSKDIIWLICFLGFAIIGYNDTDLGYLLFMFLSMLTMGVVGMLRYKVDKFHEFHTKRLKFFEKRFKDFKKSVKKGKK